MKNFRFISYEFKFLGIVVGLFILINLFVPRAELVTNDSRILYFMSGMLGLLLTILYGTKNLKLLVYSIIAVPIAFINDASYFDRFSLLSTAVTWPLIIANMYNKIDRKGIIWCTFYSTTFIFILALSRFETGW